MIITEKIKTIEQNKAEYNLDRQTPKIYSLSSENIGNHQTKFMKLMKQ